MKKNKATKEIVVIGAGHNGLCCAYYLAKAGYQITILERYHEVGGAAITEEFHPGFRNSMAAYTVSLLQPKVIKDMQLERHGLKVVLRKIDNYVATEGGYFLAGRNGLTQSEIARFSAKDALAYPKYQAMLDEVVDYLRLFLLTAPPNVGGGLADIARLIKLGKTTYNLSIEAQRNLLDFFTKSAADILDYYFEHPTVKALFAFDAVVGHFDSPYSTGSAYVLLHHVFGEAAGVREAWGHAIGGMGAITQAMKSACLEQGVRIETECEVSHIHSSNGKAKSVVANGKEYPADIVISNIHPQLLFQNLVEQDALPDDFKQRIARYQSHSGTFRMNVALNDLPQFTHAPQDNLDFYTSGIIIAPSMEYMHEAWVSANLKGWSDKPVVEMLIPSTLDNTLAPKGKHVASLFCQQFKFDLPNGMQWQNEREKVAEHILDTVEQYAPGFKQLVLGKDFFSPHDLEQRFGLVGGDIFHGKMGLDQLFSARPVLGYASHRTPIQNLYMCGSGTHPGGGVTGAPGHNAAQEILKDQKRFGIV